MGKYAVSDTEMPKRRSLGDAVDYSKTVGRDEMDGATKDTSDSLRMGDGNILEAKGVDRSNRSVDVNGWGGEDAPYKGIADGRGEYGSKNGGK